MGDPEAVVRQLYAALGERDGDGVQRLIDEHFDEGVVLHEPASLPWGGDHEGARRVGRIFVGMATAPPGTSPIDPETLTIERVAASGDQVAVELRFTLTLPGAEPVQTGAVEWFAVLDDKVVDVRAAYFDTAAYGSAD